MKKGIAITLILLVSFIDSCKSPVDVDASREKRMISIEPNDDFTGVNTDLNEVDFGLVFRDSSSRQTVSIKLLNNTDKKLLIGNCTLSKNSSFSFDSSIFPLVLQPVGSEKSTALLKLYYSPRRTGTFSDILKINNVKDLNIKLRATTPSVYVQRVDFPNTYVSRKSTSLIRIYNFGDKGAHVKQIKSFDNPDSVFIIESNLFPQTINPKSYMDINVVFVPVEQKEYIGQIEFDLFSGDNGPIFNYCILKGIGLNK